MSSTGWQWPLGHRKYSLPQHPEPGSFGQRRRYDYHTGIDLYADLGDTALAVEDGRVVAIEHFTGPDAGSPWWHATKAVLVEGTSGVVLYGEIDPSVTVGAAVQRGDLVGHVVTVLRNNKGLPMNMLHLELYTAETRESVWWRLNEKQPEQLLDPTDLLRIAFEAL
jgi:murein DD-endopeptidase MepM/ murein hydrolase activator NlpD